MTAPDTRAIEAVQRRLRAGQGPFVPGPALPIIDELVATVLSQHTSDTNSDRAFARLKAGFPSWEQVTDVPVDEMSPQLAKVRHSSNSGRCCA